MMKNKKIITSLVITFMIFCGINNVKAGNIANCYYKIYSKYLTVSFDQSTGELKYGSPYLSDTISDAKSGDESTWNLTHSDELKKQFKTLFKGSNGNYICSQSNELKASVDSSNQTINLMQGKEQLKLDQKNSTYKKSSADTTKKCKCILTNQKKEITFNFNESFSTFSASLPQGNTGTLEVMPDENTFKNNFKTAYNDVSKNCESLCKKVYGTYFHDENRYKISFNKSDVESDQQYNKVTTGKVKSTTDTKYKNFYDVSTKYYKCGNLERIPKGLPKFTNVIYKLVKVIVPIILIVMGMVDFLKAVLASDEQQMDTNPKNFMRRIGVAVLIYFVMTSVQLLVKVIGGNNQKSISSCFNCFINSEKKCETYDYKF